MIRMVGSVVLLGYGLGWVSSLDLCRPMSPGLHVFN